MHSTTIPRILVTLVSILVTVSLFQGVASLAKPTVDGTEQRVARAAGPAAEARLAARRPAPSAETAVAAMKPTTSASSPPRCGDRPRPHAVTFGASFCC